MKKALALSILSTITLLCAACGGNTGTGGGQSSSQPEKECTDDNKVHLVILTGQSGARGKAVTSDLTDEQKEESADVDICADGLTMPALSSIPETIASSAKINPLKPGYGDSANEFGPELGMGETLASRYQKDGNSRKSVIVKYTACGSTFTDHWYSKSALDDDTISDKLNVQQIRENPKTEEATGPLTNNLYQLIDSTITQLESEGYEAVIDGAIFTHGEQDAKFDNNMDIYEKALTYFIKDLREYVGDEDMPVVVTEALTNSAKYSNKLREIQKRVSDADTNVGFVSTTDLFTNTFEPWHFGASSNYVLGNRATAELLSMCNDTRAVKEFETDTVKVPLNTTVELPTYVKAKFDNDYEGYVKVHYKDSYDSSTKGEQQVKFTFDSACKTYEGSLTVNVNDDPYVDGILSEYTSAKKNTIEGVGDVYVRKGETGLYIGAKVNDEDLWTDGEAWGQGDMGQKENNDDLRVYLTTTDDVADRYTLALSSANLLRVYDAGTSLSDSGLQSKNLVYKKFISDYNYHVTTKGLANVEGGGKSQGMEMEMYVGYEDLGIENPDDIKLCFNYNDVSKAEGGKKQNTDNYLAASSLTVKAEEDISSYFAISDLI